MRQHAHLERRPAHLVDAEPAQDTRKVRAARQQIELGVADVREVRERAGGLDLVFADVTVDAQEQRAAILRRQRAAEIDVAQAFLAAADQPRQVVDVRSAYGEAQPRSVGTFEIVDPAFALDADGIELPLELVFDVGAFQQRRPGADLPAAADDAVADRAGQGEVEEVVVAPELVQEIDRQVERPVARRVDDVDADAIDIQLLQQHFRRLLRLRRAHDVVVTELPVDLAVHRSLEVDAGIVDVDEPDDECVAEYRPEVDADL